MISKTFGAPLGGTTRGAHQDLESLAVSLITPPNFGGGGGSCFPSMLIVADGEPGMPLTRLPSAMAAVAGTLEPADADPAGAPLLVLVLHETIPATAVAAATPHRRICLLGSIISLPCVLLLSLRAALAKQPARFTNSRAS